MCNSMKENLLYSPSYIISSKDITHFMLVCISCFLLNECSLEFPNNLSLKEFQISTKILTVLFKIQSIFYDFLEPNNPFVPPETIEIF